MSNVKEFTIQQLLDWYCARAGSFPGKPHHLWRAHPDFIALLQKHPSRDVLYHLLENHNCVGGDNNPLLFYPLSDWEIWEKERIELEREFKEKPDTYYQDMLSKMTLALAAKNYEEVIRLDKQIKRYERQRAK